MVNLSLILQRNINDCLLLQKLLNLILLLQSGFKYPKLQLHSPLVVLQAPFPLQFEGHSLTENVSQ